MLIISNLCYGQKQFHITVQFVPKLDSTEFLAFFDNGKGGKTIPVSLKNGKIEISSEVYSKWAILNLYSPANSSQKTYFITEDESSIIYSVDNKSAKDYPFVNSKLINALELRDCEEMKKLIAYTQKESKDVNDFHDKYKTKLRTNDSLMAIYKQKDKISLNKLLNFIKLNSDRYIYFRYFNLVFQEKQNIEADSLLQFYKENLYPKYPDLLEAKYILDRLTDRSISESIKINQPAPEFTTTDINGKKFSLRELRGKYVLINLWATWCGPCVAELPLFTKLRNDFSKDQLEIISLSVDSKKEDMEKGIKKYGLNWTNVFRDMRLVAKYQISGAIPLTFLIDKEGKLVFMHVGSLSNTDELRNLLMKK
jgi:peroxiredoxin